VRGYFPTVAAMVLLGACTNAEDVPAPRLSSLAPDRGAPGIVVSVVGSAFCQEPEPGDACSPPDAQIVFETTTAVTTILDDTNATMIVPEVAPGDYDVRISVGGRMSNNLDFVVEAP
jgi:hypothetical protein